MLSRQKYKPLDQKPSNSSQGDLLSNNDATFLTQQLALTRAKKIIYVLLFMLGVTTGTNVLFLTRQRCPLDHQSFFDLETNVPVSISHDDHTIEDPMWDSPEYDWYLGWVALENDIAKSKGLPTAMHWPWDSSKSIYILHGFHSLHCVFLLRDVIMQYHDNKEQTWSYGHITHCLHVLREDIMCAADDTPRYTGRLHAQENKTVVESGIGQIRMCRDWHKLHQHAIDNSACYYRPRDHYIPLLDRYKRCPDGSKPWEKKGHRISKGTSDG